METFKEFMGDYSEFCHGTGCEKCPLGACDATHCVGLYAYLKLRGKKINKRNATMALKSKEYKDILSTFNALCHLGNTCKGCDYQYEILPNMTDKKTREPVCFARHMYTYCREQAGLEKDNEKLWIYSGAHVLWKNAYCIVLSLDAKREYARILIIENGEQTECSLDALSRYLTRPYTCEEAVSLIGKSLSYRQSNRHIVEMITSICFEEDKEGHIDEAKGVFINGVSFEELKSYDAMIDGKLIGVRE